jgi:hypothetical protein
MVLRSGFAIFEFQTGPESRKSGNRLYFGSSEDALTWLKHLGFLYSHLVFQLRDWVVRYYADPEVFRLTDYQMLERLAGLLYSRRIVVFVVEQRTTSTAPAATTTSPPPAFPLSERTPRPTSSSSQSAPASEPATFDPHLDATAQASVLIAAAAQGQALCPE